MDQVELSKLFMAIAQVTGKEINPKLMRTVSIGQKIVDIIRREIGSPEGVETTEVLFILVDIVSYLLLITAHDPTSRQKAAIALAMELVQKANRTNMKELDEMSQAVDQKMNKRG